MRLRAWVPVAVLVVLGCRTRATVPRDPARPERDDDGSEVSDAERLRRRVTERLGLIEALLEPACGHRCGSVAALPGDDLDTSAQCEPAPAGRASIIRYRPEVLEAVLDRYDSVATYALAHEYGHHLDVTMNGAPLAGDLWVGELRADLIAGCALARANADLTEVRLVLLEELTPRDPELRQAQRRCGMDGIHPAPEWGYRAVEAGRALCAAGVPTLFELREAADPIARAARQSAAEAGTPWTGATPCEPDIAGALRALERGVGAPP